MRVVDISRSHPRPKSRGPIEAATGIPQKDERGRTIDVHAFRHTTATHLARAKVSPRVAKDFLRHSDISLTMVAYTDARLLDEAEALDALPRLGSESGPAKTGGRRKAGGAGRGA